MFPVVINTLVGMNKGIPSDVRAEWSYYLRGIVGLWTNNHDLSDLGQSVISKKEVRRDLGELANAHWEMLCCRILDAAVETSEASTQTEIKPTTSTAKDAEHKPTTSTASDAPPTPPTRTYTTAAVQTPPMPRGHRQQAAPGG